MTDTDLRAALGVNTPPLYPVQNATDAASYHLGPACDSLRDIAEKRDIDICEWLEPAGTLTWNEVASSSRGFCRVCALEPIALGLIEHHTETGTETGAETGAETAHLAVSSLPARHRLSARTKRPDELGASVSQRSRDRMVRIGEAAGLRHTAAGSGGFVVLYGTVAQPVAAFLRANFWTITAPENGSVYKDTVAAAWTLLTDGADATGNTTAEELWLVATALAD